MDQGRVPRARVSPVRLWPSSHSSNGLPPPTIDPVLTPKGTATGEPGEKDIQTIADRMLKEAEAIVRLAQEYDALFDAPAHSEMDWE